MISHTEEPEGVELVHLDHDDLEYNDPTLESMAGFERCASCSYAKDLHRSGRVAYSWMLHVRYGSRPGF